MIDSCQRRSRRSAVWRTSRGTGSHLRETRDIASRLQRPVEYLLDGHHRVEGHLLTYLLRNLVQVAAVALRQDHVGQTRGVRGQRLLLQTADRQHSPLQGDLAGHPDRVLHRAPRKQRRERGYNLYSRAWLF